MSGALSCASRNRFNCTVLENDFSKGEVILNIKYFRVVTYV